MEVVQAINPGQSLIPEWVHQGAILGVQGGTKRMLDILNQVAYYPLTMLTATEKIFPAIMPITEIILKQTIHRL